MLRSDRTQAALTRALSSFPPEVYDGGCTYYPMGALAYCAQHRHDGLAWYCRTTNVGAGICIAADTGGRVCTEAVHLSEADARRGRSADFDTADGRLPLTPSVVSSLGGHANATEQRHAVSPEQRAVQTFLAVSLVFPPEGSPEHERKEKARAACIRVVEKAYKGREWPAWAKFHLLGQDIPEGAYPADSRARTYPKPSV